MFIDYYYVQNVGISRLLTCLEKTFPFRKLYVLILNFSLIIDDSVKVSNGGKLCIHLQKVAKESFLTSVKDANFIYNPSVHQILFFLPNMLQKCAKNNYMKTIC